MSDQRPAPLTSALRRLEPVSDGDLVDNGHHSDGTSTAPANASRWLPAHRTVAFDPATEETQRAIDWDQVQRWREDAFNRLQLRIDGDVLRGTITDDTREHGRAIIQEILKEFNDQQIARGVAPLDHQAEHAHVRAVYDALFGHGRLQRLLDMPEVENIEITGHDQIDLLYADGRVERVGAIADSDGDLIRDIAFFANLASRAWDRANPRLHMTLRDGSRLAATAYITPRPVVTIRRHLHRTIDLAQLAHIGSLSADLAEFLRTAVRAGMSIVVAGVQGEGKTTLLRALANEVPEEESIATIETEYELHLEDMPNPHRRVVAYEARPGTGEPTPTGRRAGEITEQDILYDSFRGNYNRVIVGEVRGGEILPMIEAMQSGRGSLSTTHAENPHGAVERLVTAALKTNLVSEEFAYRALAASLDLIVQVRLHDDRRNGGERARFVTQVVLVQPGESGRPALTDIYVPGPDLRAVLNHVPESVLRKLERAGLDRRRFLFLEDQK